MKEQLLKKRRSKLSDLNDKIFKFIKHSEDQGFKWSDHVSIINQIKNETKEVSESLENNESKQRLEEEIGDLFHAIFSLCSFLNLDPDQILTKTERKFRTRFNHMIAIAKDLGLKDLNGQSHEFMLEIWDQVKASEKEGQV